MLNTLANHAILPHNGQNITKDITVNALFNALNIDKALGEFLFNFAVTTNPQPNATTFNLDHLSRHNILEHDASLSRADFYFGNHDNHDFNQTVFDQTRSYWKGPIIDIQDAANARLARVLDSKAKNPTFTLSALGEAFGYGESAAYILVLGDRVKGQVKKAFVEYLFGQFAPCLMSMFLRYLWLTRRHQNTSGCLLNWAGGLRRTLLPKMTCPICQTGLSTRRGPRRTSRGG